MLSVFMVPLFYRDSRVQTQTLDQTLDLYTVGFHLNQIGIGEASL